MTTKDTLLRIIQSFDTNLEDADSLTLVSIILEIETHYNIEFPLSSLDIEAVRDVDRLAQAIDTLLL